jgi:putative DNA-invertase from lambdoid prophage Rac
MSRIAYYRVSTADQSTESQRFALGGGFDKEFQDEGISGTVPAKSRPGFSDLLKYIREGDSLHVYAVDRLGRDALDVQATVRDLLARGVTVEVQGLGTIARGVGELILAVLAQVADMERNKIVERTTAGRLKAQESLKTTGETHRGKKSMGRPTGADRATVVAWRINNKASISQTAQQFEISQPTVKRYCAALQKASQAPIR